MNLFNKIFCKHKDCEFIENVYGDKILYISNFKYICRSLWKCKKCGVTMRNQYLVRNEHERGLALKSKFF